MIDQFIIDNIATVGFPIVLVFYLMFRFEKILNKLTDAVTNLTVYLNGNKNNKKNR